MEGGLDEQGWKMGSEREKKKGRLIAE